jgi:hypothetical protein
MEYRFEKLLKGIHWGISAFLVLALAACFGASPQGAALPIANVGSGAALPGAATPPPSDESSNPPSDGTPLRPLFDAQARSVASLLE